MDYNQVGSAIVKHCGGLLNLQHVTNCMTRVRMTIGDRSQVDIAALKSIDGVLGVVEDDTLQVIVGPGKSTKVADVINDMLKAQPVGETPPGEATLSAVEQRARWRGQKPKSRPGPKLFLSTLPIFSFPFCRR